MPDERNIDRARFNELYNQKSQYYEPVLLYEGFEPVLVAGPAGGTTPQTITLAKRRGVVCALDVIVPFLDGPTNDNPGTCTLFANGQEVLRDTPLSQFVYYKTSGRDEEELIQILLNEREKLTFRSHSPPGLLLLLVQLLRW